MTLSIQIYVRTYPRGIYNLLHDAQYVSYFLEYQQQRESRHAGEIHGREKNKVRNWRKKKRGIIANSREEMK
jgi:hypothetical protein